jgi:primosomal protein N' (replication factor Y)
MPEMKLVNLATAFLGSGQKGVNLISPVLEKSLRGVLDRGEQAILLLNRRGYSNFVFCPKCGHGLHCKNCDVTLTFHKKGGVRKTDTVLGSHIGGGYAVCHYCMAKTLVPRKCPLCKSGMTMIGLGAPRLEEELSRKLPNAKVARVDSDSMAGGDYWRLLKDFSDGKIEVLAGTQMLAKGLHFPNVTLVGVVSADTSLSLPDFRANERTFQLLSQVAGRAGRGVKGGKVIVQTFMPDQPAIKFAMDHDYAGFVEAELACREKCNLPPYWRMAIIGLRDEKFERLTPASDAMRVRIDEIVSSNELEVKVRGPMPATISRIGGFHRMQIVIQAAKSQTIQRLFGYLRGMGAIRPAVRVSFDIDPASVM